MLMEKFHLMYGTLPYVIPTNISLLPHNCKGIAAGM